MIVKAQVSFSGLISMYAGETRDIPAGEVLNDLLAAGYVEPMEEKQPKKKFEMVRKIKMLKERLKDV